MGIDSLPFWRGVRWRLLAAIFALGSLGCAVIAYHSARAMLRAERGNLGERAARAAGGLARIGREAVVSDDLYRQLPGLLAAVAREPDFLFVRVYSPEGVLLAFEGPSEGGAADSGSVVQAEAEVSPVGLGDGPRGRVVVGLSTERGRRAALRAVFDGLGVAFLVCLGGFFGIGLLLRRFLLPVERIVRADAAAQDGGGGDIPPEEFPENEFGLIMRSRAKMMAALRLSEAQARALAASEARRAGELEKALSALEEARVELTRSEKLSALGRVLAGVAHELNNPLTAVLGFAQLVKEDAALAAHAGLREDLDSVLGAARRCRRIVADLCAFTRTQPLRRVPVAMKPALLRCLALERGRLEDARVTLELETPDGLPEVLADEAQVERAASNLFVNACQALEGVGGGTVVVRLRPSGGALRLEVQDDGPGVEASSRERLFEPFFSTKPVGKGTGLGLAIVRGIARQHGGDAGFEAPPQGGALFYVDFPLAPGSESAAARAAVAGASKLRVLVVDDEEPVRRMLGRLLSAMSHESVLAADAAEALRLLSREGYDCILVDVRMPGMDGLALLESAERALPGVRRRWAFITGSIEEGTWEAVLRTGAPALRKPFAREDLARLLAKVAGNGGGG